MTVRCRCVSGSLEMPRTGHGSQVASCDLRKGDFSHTVGVYSWNSVSNLRGTAVG